MEHFQFLLSVHGFKDYVRSEALQDMVLQEKILYSSFASQDRQKSRVHPRRKKDIQVTLGRDVTIQDMIHVQDVRNRFEAYVANIVEK